jgi:ABC-type uncharacterized transport system permease subunit
VKRQALMILFSLALLLCLCLLFSPTPMKSFSSFVLGPFESLYFLGNLLNSATPLLIGSLGMCISLQGGSFNLGGEGQIYLGGFLCAILSIGLSSLGAFGAVLAVLISILAAAIVAGLSGLFKSLWKTSELISSYLISNALILIVNYLVTGPFQDPSTNLFSTQKIPQAFRLSKILLPSDLSSALLIALALCLLSWLLLYKTKQGYEFRLYGSNPRFCQYGGISPSFCQIAPMVISGGFYGLAGSLSVLGTYYSCVKEFSSQMGFNALAIALIARKHPILALPASLFFAWLSSGSRIAMQRTDVTVEMALIVQAAVFLLVTCTFAFKRKKSL